MPSTLHSSDSQSASPANRISSANLAQLLDAIDQAVIAIDLQGKVIYWNRAAERLYGWTAEEVNGRALADLGLHAAAPGEIEQIAGGLLSGESWSGGYLAQRRDGSVVPILVTGTPLQDGDGQLLGVVGVSAHLGPSKPSELLLRRLLTELNDGAIMIVDRNLRYVFAAGQRFTPHGQQPEDSVGRHVAHFLEPKARRRMLASLRKAFDGESLSLELENSGRISEVHVGPLQSSDGAVQLVGVVSHDITERHRNGRERERLIADARQARQEIGALLEATATTGADTTPDAVLRRLIAQAAHLLQAESACYTLVDQEGAMFYARQENGRWIDGRVDLSSAAGVLGLVQRTGRVFRTNDLATYPLGGPELRADQNTHSLVAAPLRHPDGSIAGVVQLTNSHRPEGFTAHDETILLALCNFALIDFHRAREAQRRRAAEEASAHLEGVVLAGRAVARHISQELATILGRAETLAQLLGDSQPLLQEHLTQIRTAASEIASATAQLQRASRVVPEPAPGLVPMLDMDASCQ